MVQLGQRRPRRQALVQGSQGSKPREVKRNQEEALDQKVKRVVKQQQQQPSLLSKKVGVGDI